MTKTFAITMAALGSLSWAACGDNLEDGGDDTTTEAAPDYDRAFPQDRVGRLDIVIPASSWTTMRADMTDMVGEFGSGGAGGGGGGGGGMELPPELIQACDGLIVGAACSASFMGMEIEGTCTELEGVVACTPEGGGPGGPGGPGGGTDLLSRTPVYVESTVTADGETWEHVGIRYKGNSSLMSSWSGGIGKLPFRLKFDEFQDTYPEVDRQRFFGFRSLSLSNGWSDPSLVHDKLGTQVFAQANFDVPATAFYQVFVDHGEGPIYFGLYTVTELPSDKVFLRTHFGEDDGNLYKPEGATFATFDAEAMGKENHEDAADYADVQGLFDALHADRTDPAAWRGGLERWLDVDGFLRWLAYNTVVQDWDTYGRMAHNFYLYGPRGEDGRLRWIPWDHSFAFGDGAIGGGGGGGGLGVNTPLSLAMDEVGDDWPLIRYLLDDPSYRAVYDGYVAEAAATVYAPDVARARFAEARALIEPFVIGSGGEQPGYTHLTSPTTFGEAHAALLAHPASRAAAVAEYLAR